MRKLFNDAERWGFFVGKNPARLVPPPKVVKKVARYAAVEPYRTIDAIAIYGGLREGEILDLKRDDLDLAHNLILVQRSTGNATTKCGKFRAIPIPSEG